MAPFCQDTYFEGGFEKLSGITIVGVADIFKEAVPPPALTPTLPPAYLSDSEFLQNCRRLLRRGFHRDETPATEEEELAEHLEAIKISDKRQDSRVKKSNVQLAQVQTQQFVHGGSSGEDVDCGGEVLIGTDGSAGGTGRAGDWRCMQCGSKHFSWQFECYYCHVPYPENVSIYRSHAVDVSEKDGDLKCLNPHCVNNSYSWQAACSCCHAPEPEEYECRPEGGRRNREDRYGLGRYGDWKCRNPECGTCNFSWSLDCHTPSSEDFRPGPLPDDDSAGPSKSSDDGISRGRFGPMKYRKHGSGHGGPTRGGRPGGDRRQRPY